MNTEYFFPISYTVATYNVGQKFDYKQLLLRNGQHSTDSMIQKLYQSIIPDYQKALVAFNLDTKPNKPFWEHPSFKVTENDESIFGEQRIEKLKSVYDMMRQTCDIVLLQEVESMNEVDLVKNTFSENFDWVYDVGLNYQKHQVADTLIGWNKTKFTKLEGNKEKSGNIKFTSAVLRDKKNEVLIYAASLHAPGFEIKNPTYKNILPGDKTVSTLIENFYANQKQYPTFFSFVGGDFNTQFKPSYYSTEDELKLSQNRFKILEDEGFLHVDQDQPTAYNKDIAAMRDGDGSCDLDHIYIKKGSKKGTFREVNGLSSCFSIEDPSINGSDHRPLFFEFNLEI